MVWWALRYLGVDEWIVSVIKAMYRDGDSSPWTPDLSWTRVPILSDSGLSPTHLDSDSTRDMYVGHDSDFIIEVIKTLKEF